MSSDESVTLKNIHEEIVKNRNELRNIIEASEARVLLKIETINNKVFKLEKENRELKNKIELLERQHKKNNIIIFGVNKPSHEISAQSICQEINSLLETNLIQEDINDTYRLGKAENLPIKVELSSQSKKKTIIQNRHKLKGKKIVIVHDLTWTQREEARILKRHLLLAQENTESKCYIKGNKLFVNNIAYTARDLTDPETEQDNSGKKIIVLHLHLLYILGMSTVLNHLKTYLISL